MDMVERDEKGRVIGGMGNVLERVRWMRGENERSGREER
jgi:hypothetical protein